jgi:hypothetical protein
MTEPLSGADYRVKAQHPRRPGPLRITAKDGTLIAVSGQICAGVSAEHLASMIRQGFVERVPSAMNVPAVANLSRLHDVPAESLQKGGA